MSSKNLKVVAVGAGYFSQFHYEAWQRVVGAEVVGNCNRHLEAANEIGKRYGIAQQSDNLAQLIEQTQPDIVDIITPPHTHLQQLEIVCEAGVDAIIQKPFGESLAQAKQLTAMAKQAGIKLIVHENFRFMPWYRKIKQLLDGKVLGRLLNVQFNLRPGDGQGSEAYLERQPYFQQMEKFLVHETAIHLVDTFRYLFGEVENVYASLRKCNPVIAGEDAGLIVFGLAGQLQAVFDGNRLLDHKADNKRTTMGEMLVEGSQASLRLDGDANIFLRNFGDNNEQQIDYSWQAKNFGGDCVYQLIEHVVAHYQHGAELENLAQQYLRNIEIENAIYQSHQQQKRVSI
jgi:predicted dehydrogenase